jgi:hypothetical protein
MMKKVIRSVILFLGIVALFPLFYLVYFYFSVGDGSRWFGTCDGEEYVMTWLDSNADGIQDTDEKPFANVCIWDGVDPNYGVDLEFSCESQNRIDINHTDEHGFWGKFLPGGKCEDYFVFAKAPDGFQPTTSLISNGCNAKFGFVAKDVSVKQKFKSVDEFIQQRKRNAQLMKMALALVIVAAGVAGAIWLQKP